MGIIISTSNTLYVQMLGKRCPDIPQDTYSVPCPDVPVHSPGVLLN